MIRNPIIRGFNPDPSVCKGHDGYYLAVSSFEYYPAIPIYKSVDLINWELINYALSSNIDYLKLDNTPDSQGLFAPTIRFYNNRYYVISTVLNTTKPRLTENFLVYTENPHKKWSKPVSLDIDGIDPSLYFEDGIGYIQYSSNDSNGISCTMQCEINLDTFELGESKIISYGTGGRDAEAPHLFKKNGKYYLLMAEGGTREGHMVTILSSKNIWGPYLAYENNPILTHRDLSCHPFQNVGHADIVKDDLGNWYMFALGVRPKGMFKHNLGREVMIKPFKWDNEWPEIDGPINVIEKDIKVKQKRNNSIVYNWKELNTIPIEFISMRNSYNNYANIKNNYLMLKATPNKISDANEPAVLLLKQKEYNFIINSTINLSLSKGYNGLVVLNGSKNFITITIKDSNIEVVKRCYDLEVVEHYKVSNKDQITLFIKGNERDYIVGYENQELTKMSRELLSTELSESPFTGVLFGNYSKDLGSVGYFEKTEVIFEEENIEG